MRVITGAITSIRWSNRLDGLGSDKHVDFGEDNIRFLMSSTDADWKSKKVGDGLLGIANGFKSTNGNFARSDLILSTKESNWSAERVDGGFGKDELERWQTWLGVPQGSMLELLIYSSYTTPLLSVISNHPIIQCHF